MNPDTILIDEEYLQAQASLEKTLGQLKTCSAEETENLRREFSQLQEMLVKLTSGRVEIVLFGEISTGKSALINALLGRDAADVDVRGGWTKEIWRVDWEGCAYCVPGLADSQVVLVDTPGLNEVGGADRAVMAREAAERADLILFVADSDLNETEFSALLELASSHKPIILVLNKIDLYTPEQLASLKEVFSSPRFSGMIRDDHVMFTSADPREVEYVIQAADGSQRSEWRKPPPNVEDLKLLILKVLDQDGLALLALNAAMYAADKSDRIAALRVELRQKRANQIIMSYATVKAAAVALCPIAVVDIVGGGVVDVAMVATLAHVYSLEMSWSKANQLALSILKAAGWVMLGEAIQSIASSAFKAMTLGYGTILTAVPQGAAAGYGSYIVGQAAKYYFEHGSSWGEEGPKTVVRRILQQTDKLEVLSHLKDEIRKKIEINPHAKG